MKFQILFLSLLPTTTHARYEPNLRLRDDILESDSGGNASASASDTKKTFHVHEGGSVTLNCGSGQCCIPRSFSPEVDRQGMMWTDPNCSGGFMMTSGSANNCKEKQCVISCDEGCEVNVQDGSFGGNDENGSSSRQPLLPPTAPTPSPSRTIPIAPRDSGGNASASGPKTKKTYHVHEGGSVTFQCGSGSLCCMESPYNQCHASLSGGYNTDQSGMCVSTGSLIKCKEKQYDFSCDEGCEVNVQEIGPKKTFHVHEGGSATIQCRFGSQCCATGFRSKLNDSVNGERSGCNYFDIVETGSANDCQEKQCVISCDEGCEVNGGVVGNDGKDSSSSQSLQPPTPPQPQPSPSRPIPIPPNSGGNTSAMKTTRVAEGDSATFECRSGSKCRVTPNSFYNSSYEDSKLNEISKGYNGSLKYCKEKQCVISCDEGCEVNVKPGSVGGNDGKDSSSRQPLLPPTPPQPKPQPPPAHSRAIPVAPPTSGGTTVVAILLAVPLLQVTLLLALI